MKISKKLLSIFLLIFPIFLAATVSAHCPLCTAGAAVAAGGAVWLGVSKVVVSLFIGAFAMSMGMWFSRTIKKKYIPMQNTIIILGVFLITVIPILPIMTKTHSFYLSLFGNYGSLLNRTYLIDMSLFGSFLGGVIVFISPKINKKIKEKRGGKGIPYQGILITFMLLLIFSLIIQFTI